MLFSVLLTGVFFLAWSNGANDNFKGVATLYGSGTTTLKAAFVWATAATAVGSLTSILIARSLAVSFSGKGLIPESSLGRPLVTLLSPVLAMVLAAGSYMLLRRLRHVMAITEETCPCLGTGASNLQATSAASSTLTLQTTPPALEVVLGHGADCRVHFPERRSMRFRARRLVDGLHYLSGGAVCFARAVNDTPKIATLLLATGAAGAAGLGTLKLALVALAMVLGGWLHSTRVAQTMSLRITELNAGQGLTANLVTSGLVLDASQLGLPVSTTHVSCGAIFGIGLASGQGYWATIRRILVTWGTTLPLALLLGLVFGYLLQSLDF
jgi:PiT family inorganic phosphate transporter